jgi:hypothetical protein
MVDTSGFLRCVAALAVLGACAPPAATPPAAEARAVAIEAIVEPPEPEASTAPATAEEGSNPPLDDFAHPDKPKAKPSLGGEGIGIGALSRRRDPGDGSSSEPQPKMVIGKPTVQGKLSSEALMKSVRRHSMRIRFCYERALQDDATLSGTVVVKLTIDREGSVTKSERDGGSLTSFAVGDCVARAFFGLAKVPPEAGTAEVRMSLSFMPP